MSLVSKNGIESTRPQKYCGSCKHPTAMSAMDGHEQISMSRAYPSLAYMIHQAADGCIGCEFLVRTLEEHDSDHVTAGTDRSKWPATILDLRVRLKRMKPDQIKTFEPAACGYGFGLFVGPTRVATFDVLSEGKNEAIFDYGLLFLTQKRYYYSS
jgi:hypothetical protein